MQTKAQATYQRLPLEKAYNVRDLGGIATIEGITRGHIFLRGDDPFFMTKQDCDFLLDYGLQMVIDLRSEEEVAQMPNPFRDMAGVQYVCIPLLKDFAPEAQAIDLRKFNMGDMYCWMLENANDGLRLFFETIATCQGAAYFHCAVGKDRTGTAAALLLSLAGAAREDIIANYQITQTHIAVLGPALMKKIPDAPISALLESPPSNMIQTLDFLQEKYGGAAPYLRRIGVPQKALDTVISHFVQPLI